MFVNRVFALMYITNHGDTLDVPMLLYTSDQISYPMLHLKMTYTSILDAGET